jgi:hypothetical protein
MAAGLHPCCVHCQDGSPCEPRDSHQEPCFDCPVPYVPADAMHELAKPFLPPSPQGENPYPPYAGPWGAAERPAVIVQSMLPARDLTGPMAALTDAQLAVEAVQKKRAQLAGFMLRDLGRQHDDGQPTREDMEYALNALRAVPVPDPYADAPDAITPVYGQVPVAEVLARAEAT